MGTRHESSCNYFHFAAIPPVRGAPIWLAISIPAVIGIFSSTTPSLFLTATYGGLDSFPLMAIPFFILAGGPLDVGGVDPGGDSVNFYRSRGCQ